MQSNILKKISLLLELIYLDEVIVNYFSFMFVQSGILMNVLSPTCLKQIYNMKYM